MPSARSFVNRIALSDANRFTLEPPLLLTPVGLLYKNFELFVFVSVDAATLHALAESLCDLFTSTLHGRCELRCGKTLLFLDFVLAVGDAHAHVFACVRRIFGDGVRVALHRGKYQPREEDGAGAGAGAATTRGRGGE